MSNDRFFQKFDIVWFEILDTETGLVSRLLSYIASKQIHPFTYTTTPTMWAGGFYPEEAEMVEQWLKANRVDEESP